MSLFSSSILYQITNLFAPGLFHWYCMMQVAKNNGLLYDEDVKAEQKQGTQVISVVHTKAEELNQKIQLPQNGFDVLVSEWMGYCLLYESMLSSVIYARDHFLKPGGAILPDTATIVSPWLLAFILCPSFPNFFCLITCALLFIL